MSAALEVRTSQGLTNGEHKYISTAACCRELLVNFNLFCHQSHFILISHINYTPQKLYV